MKEVSGSFQRIRQPLSYFKLFPYSQGGRHSGQVSLFLIGRLFSYILPDATRKGCVSPPGICQKARLREFKLA